MTKFENIGMAYQQDAASKEESDQLFHKSCTLCCDRGLRIDCKKCGISYMHTLVLAAFDVLEQSATPEV